MIALHLYPALHLHVGDGFAFMVALGIGIAAWLIAEYQYRRHSK